MIMERQCVKKELIENIFTKDEDNKRLDFDWDNNGDFLVINRKSGVYDKKCFPKQEINIKRIINHSLNDSNVKFKKLMKPISEKEYSTWKITKDQILDNALSYLKAKGIDINNPYKNETDLKFFRRMISKILTDYIVPAIYTCEDYSAMSDTDDISEYFKSAIKKIKDIYTNNNMDNIIYGMTDCEVFGDINAKYGYYLSFDYYNKLFLFQFDHPANFDIPFAITRFTGHKMYFELMFWKVPDMYFLPRFFFYYHEKIDKIKFTENEINKYIALRAFTEVRKKYCKDIAEYYSVIIDNIKEFTDRILTMDYNAILKRTIKDSEECKEALKDFEINCEDIWCFLEENDISNEEIIDYIRSLIEKSVSRFCNSIHILCTTKIYYIDTDYKQNKSIEKYGEIKIDRGLLDMEVVDSSLLYFNNLSNESNESNKSSESSESNENCLYNYDKLSDNFANNKNCDIEIACKYYNLPTELIIFKNDIETFYSNNNYLKLDNIYQIASSDKMEKLINIYDSLASAINNIRISKSVILLNINSDSKMYKTAISESENGFKYNMFEDLKNSLEELNNHIKEIN